MLQFPGVRDHREAGALLRDPGDGPAADRGQGSAPGAARGTGNQAGPFQFADEARTVCIIAGGPSLTQSAVDCCRGWPTIAVNDAYRLAPWATVLYACDRGWWDLHIGAVRESFAGEIWTQDAEAAKAYGLNRVIGAAEPGLCRQAGKIHYGGNSGCQAINLAFHWGARRMVLLGFDCQPKDGQRHWFGEHPAKIANHSNYPLWVKNFRRLAADLQAEGVEVVNCSPHSALTFWPYVPVETALACDVPDSRAAGV